MFHKNENANENQYSAIEEAESNTNSSKTIKYSYNTSITPGMGKDDGGKKTDGWQFAEICWQDTDITDMIHKQAYTVSELVNGHRAKSNVLAVYNIVLDFDKGTPSFQSFLTDAKLYQFSWVAHTTVNHQKIKRDPNTGVEIPGSAVDKFRVIIPLNEAISEAEYETCKAMWMKRFPSIDPTSFEGSRYYMLNPNAEVHFHDYKASDGSTVFIESIDAGVIKKTSTGINLAGMASSEGMNSFTPDMEVTTSTGVIMAVGEITSRTQVLCPFCDPAARQSPTKHNAFVNLNKKGKRYLHCSSEAITYWEIEPPETIAKKCDKFWSHSTSVYEAGMVSDTFSLENISEKKFYIKVGAESKDEKARYFDNLVKSKHLHRINRINNIGDVNATESTFVFDQVAGNITVKIKALPVNIRDNDFMEKYFDNAFGQYKTFIKEWLAVYVYSNYVKLPTIILTGDRGVGKNTFAESILAIFPVLSEIARDLQNNFTPFAEKKLLIIDESASNGKVQYQMLKKFSGQKFLEVNKKYLAQYQVQNNMNIIFLSNDELPIYVERDELPTDTRNNQFFVYRMKPHSGFDAKLQEKIIDRLGHYVRSELKSVFEALNLSAYRYAIDTPITPEEKKLFNNSVTDIEAEADRLIDVLETRMTDPTWNFYKFTQAGIIPSSFFNDFCQNYKGNKVKVIQNLQKRGYLTNDPSQHYQQIEKQRPYCYKLGKKVSVRKCLDRHFEGRADTSIPLFPEAS